MPSEILQILIEAQNRASGALHTAARDVAGLNDAVNKAALISAKADADMAVSRQRAADALRVISAREAADIISTREKVTGQLEVVDTKAHAAIAVNQAKATEDLKALKQKGDDALFLQAERNRGTREAIEKRSTARIAELQQQATTTIMQETAKSYGAIETLRARYEFRRLEREEIATRRNAERLRREAVRDSNPFSRLSHRIDEFIDPAAGLLGSLGKVAMVAAPIAAVGAAVVGLTKDLGDSGQVAIQTERKFAAFSGGASQAADNLVAMRAATDNGMASMDAMGAASMLLSMGLADSGEKAAHLTRMAMMLGPAWRDAETNINDFTMLLANQSIRRLDQFGLSVEGVRAKRDEFMAQGFAKDIAFTNAVLEIGAHKMKQLEDAGVKAATSAQQLAAAWKNLRTELGKSFAQPVADLEASLAAGLAVTTRQLQMGSKDPQTRLTGLLSQLQYLKEQRTDIDTRHMLSIDRKEALAENATAISRITAEIDKVRMSTHDWGKAMRDAGMSLESDMIPMVDALSAELPTLDAQIKAVSASFAGMGNAQFVGLLDKEIKTWESARAKLQGQLLTYNLEQQQLRDAMAAGDKKRVAMLKDNLDGVDLNKLLFDIKLAEQNLQGLTIQKRDIEIKILLTPEPETLMDTYMQHMMLTGAQGVSLPVNHTWRTLPLDPMMAFKNAPSAYGMYGERFDEAPSAADFAQVLDRQKEAIEDRKRADKEAANEWKSQAKKVGDAWEGAVKGIPGLPGNVSKVSEADMAKAKAGLYEPKADEKLRQLKDLIYNPEGAKKGNYGFSIADFFNAGGIGALAGGDIDTLKAGYAIIEEMWNSGEFFANPANLKWLNKDAAMGDLRKQGLAAQGKQNVFSLFGIQDENSAMMLEALGLKLGPEALKKIVPTEKEAIALKKSFAETVSKAVGEGTDVMAATIWGAAYTDSSAQQTKMTTTGQNMGGALITGINKAEPDLWQAGYNAAMAMQAGWNAATSGKPPTGTQPPNGNSGYNSKLNEYGVN